MDFVIEHFVLHGVDRDPETGAYGAGLNGASIYIPDLGDYPIHSVDVKNNTVTIGSRTTLQLGNNGNTDMNLYEAIFVYMWNTKWKKIWEKDEDFVDYCPSLYKSLEDVAKGNSELYRAGLERK